MNFVQISAEDGHCFEAYVSLPIDQKPAAGIMMLQYICGVNAVMRRLADGFARLGYVVMVPDLYARQAPGVQLIADPSNPDQEEMDRAMALNNGFDDKAATLDMKAALRALRSHPRCDGRAGTLGYCLGGRLAYLASVRTDTNCAVGYYPVNLQQYLPEAVKIRQPLMLHMAASDVLVPPAVREEICQVLSNVVGVEIIVHPDVNHAFALPGGPNYNEPAASRANAASVAFLQTHLSPRLRPAQ